MHISDICGDKTAIEYITGKECSQYYQYRGYWLSSHDFENFAQLDLDDGGVLGEDGGNDSGETANGRHDHVGLDKVHKVQRE